MRTCATLLCACAALVAFAPTPASAQLGHSFFVGGGMTVPTGDYNTYAKPGWIGMGGISFSQEASRVWFGGEGYYGHNAHDDSEGGATNLYGGNAFVGYDFGDGTKPTPYIYGAAGMLVHSYSPAEGSADVSDSETKPAFGGGAGVNIPMGSAHLWAEAKYMATKYTKLIPILIGLSFGRN